MKDRNFSTEKLAKSIKVLVKAAGISNTVVYKEIHMSPSYYYKVIGFEQTI